MTAPLREPPPESIAGQQALALQLFRERRTEGLSSLEAIRLQILRLPNRVSELRKRDFVFRSLRERNGCLRYWLVSEPLPADTHSAPKSSQASASPPAESISCAEETERLRGESMPLFAKTPDQRRR